MPNVLGLDLGRRCGFALAGPNYLKGWKPRSQLEGPRPCGSAGLTYGGWKLGDHASHDALYANLWARLDDVHAVSPLNVLAYESAGTRFESAAAIWIVCGLVVVCMTWAKHNGVQGHPVHNQAMKKHATGHGHSEKDLIDRAARRLGWEPQSPDVADALFVLDLCLTEWQRS